MENVNEDDDNPLALFTADDLIEELQRRFDDIAIVGARVLDAGEDGDCEIASLRRWKGDVFRVTGLLSWMHQCVCKYIGDNHNTDHPRLDEFK